MRLTAKEKIHHHHHHHHHHHRRRRPLYSVVCLAAKSFSTPAYPGPASLMILRSAARLSSRSQPSFSIMVLAHIYFFCPLGPSAVLFLLF
jgi:hypothetical protein